MSHISFKCFHYGGCRDITQVRIETRRDRGGLEPKSKRGWRKREDRLRRTGDTQGHGPSTQRTRIDADTGRRKQMNIYIYMSKYLIKKLQPAMGHRTVTTEQAGEQMPMPVRCVAQKGAGRRCCRKHSGVPRNSASLLENLHRKSYGAKEEGRT